MLHKRAPSGGRTSSHDVTAPRSSARERAWEAPIAGADTGFIAQTKQLFDGYEMTSDMDLLGMPFSSIPHVLPSKQTPYQKAARSALSVEERQQLAGS